MTASYDKNTAVVATPALGGGCIGDRRLRAWLAQGDLDVIEAPYDWLALVLAEIGATCEQEGRAALRMWGQTGDRPDAWIAGADPVYLEARLDHLCLHALASPGLEREEMRTLFDHLQRTLGDGSPYGFARLGTCGYVSAEEPFATALLPAASLDLRVPNDFLPAGEAAARQRAVQSEIEMALHEHAVNVERESRGEQPVNSLWLWGGGIAPEQRTEATPPLFGNDPLATGWWLAHTAVTEPWPGSIEMCTEAAVAGFVAIVPCDEAVEPVLLALRAALAAKRLRRLVLLSRDGIRIELRRAHALRIWRRTSPLLEAQV